MSELYQRFSCAGTHPETATVLVRKLPNHARKRLRIEFLAISVNLGQVWAPILWIESRTSFRSSRNSRRGLAAAPSARCRHRDSLPQFAQFPQPR